MVDTSSKKTYPKSEKEFFSLPESVKEKVDAARVEEKADVLVRDTPKTVSEEEDDDIDPEQKDDTPGGRGFVCHF